MDSKISKNILIKFNELSEANKIELISILLKQLKASAQNQVPIGIFANKLSSLEAIVKYLRENMEYRLSKIAKLLNRNSKSIWSTYHNAKKKMPSGLSNPDSAITIPTSIFADRKLSVLETLVSHLKDLELTNHEIALLLQLNDRTIWSVYNKAKLKGIKYKK